MAILPQDDRFYKPASLWKWFGITSGLMMIFTLWMLMDDFGRDWKGYQSEFFALRQKKYDEWIEAAKGSVDATKVQAAERSLAEGIKAIGAHEKEIDGLKAELVKLKTREKLDTNKYQAAKGVWDVEKYEYEANYGYFAAQGHLDKIGARGEAARKTLLKHLRDVEKLRDAMNTATQGVEAKQHKIGAFTEQKKQAEKDLKNARFELDRLQDAKKATELTLSKIMRNAPLLDMANPVLRLQQIVLPTIRDDIYFAQVGKVDRCTSCHMAIDIPGYEKEKQPFRTHPRLELILGSQSKHPIDQVGCTVCHEGRGQASEFVRSAHTPRNEEQKKQWEKKYHWEEMHHVAEKMLPLQFTEGKCRVCHKDTEYIPKAEKATAAYQIIRSAGCYGCHRIEGWDHLRKPAPSLKRIKGKVTRDWMAKWVRSPQSFNANARMPAIFHQSNIVTEDYRKYQEAELQAVSDYLMKISDNYAPNISLPAGNAARGKELFGSIGCLGCHQVDDFGSEARRRYNPAPDLSSVGSKVTRPWLQSWLRNPRHYWADTTMPSLRLTDGEISDVSAYLLSKRNREFEALAAGKSDVDAQRQVLRLYLLRDPKLAPATDTKIDAVLAKLKPHEITERLGYKAVQRYGCFGCHEIKGFETVAGIGAELSEWGSKLPNKLDFGLLHGEHNNYSWFHGKMTDSRVYDKGLVKEYLDLLRMPKFTFTEGEIARLTTAILGFTAQKVEAPTAKRLASWEAQHEQTSRLIHKYNCQGCHVVEGIFAPLPDDSPYKEEHDKLRLVVEGRVLAYYQDDETLGPPPLVTQGPRVKSPWVHAFLKDPGALKLRDKLKIRMPTFQFTNDELNTITTGWAMQGKVEFPYLAGARVEMTSSELATAQSMFGSLQCLNCHTVNRRPTVEEMEGGSRGLAPDLVHANARLHRKWIEEILKDPQKMIPGTRMPGFWPSDGPSPLPKVLGGDSKKQVELLAKYLHYLGQSKVLAPAAPVKKQSE